ncbi:PAS domain S-box protein [Candidatus Binatia bacterium]|nr:PAS domain S-box protein [Candidatus Binatia bacterium]
MSDGRTQTIASHAATSRASVVTGVARVAFVVAVAAFARWGLDPWLGGQHVYPPFLFAVAFATWWVGVAGGLTALVFGYVAGNVLFVAPHGGPSLLGPLDAAAVAELPVYTARAVVLIVLVRALSRKDQELRRAHANFASIAEGIADVLWILDTERRRMIYVSPAYEQIFGRSPEPLLRDLATWADTIHPDDRAHVGRAWRTALTDQRGEVEYRIIRPDGGVRWIRHRGFPTRVPGQMVGISTDVTRLHEAETRLRTSEERFRGIYEHTPTAIVITDASGRFAECNPAYCALLGYGEEELREVPLVDLLHPADRENNRHQIARLRRGEIAHFEIENRYVRKDGTPVWVHKFVSVIRDASGAIAHLVALVTDMTERRRAQEEIVAQTDLLRTITDNATTAIFMMDPAGRLTFMNPAAEAMTGLARDEVRGRVLHELVHHTRPDGSSYPMAECPIDRARPQGVDVRDHEDVFVRKDGTLFPVLVNARPVFGDDPSLGTVIEVRDISRQKELEAEHVRMMAELQDASRRKDEFLAMLAHELRNPLAPIRNAAHVLRMVSPGEPRIERAREIIDRQVVHMTRLIDDLLDVSRITRSKIELQKERLLLREVVENAVEASRPVLEAALHTIAVNAGPDVWIEGDRARLVQVLTNLLTNAAKFTPRGGHVALLVTRRDGAVAISVRDTGVGIPRDAQQRIFDLFQQENVSLERTHGGLGIGLTLVKRLVEMHGGTVAVASEGAGKGAEFTIVLPVLAEVAVQPAESADARHGASGPMRVLVVEDNEDAAESFRMLLELHGHVVRVARDGLDGLRAFEEFAPEVAFVDLGLPGIDGFGVAERIRALAGRRPVLVALSGYGRDEDKRRAQDAGFDAHMTKPVDHDRVEAFLRDLAASPREGRPATVH